MSSTSIRGKEWVFNALWAAAGLSNHRCVLNIPLTSIFYDGKPFKTITTDPVSGLLSRIYLENIELDRLDLQQQSTLILRGNDTQTIRALRKLLAEYQEKFNYNSYQRERIQSRANIKSTSDEIKVEEVYLVKVYYTDGTVEDIPIKNFDILLRNEMWRLQILMVQAYIPSLSEMTGFYTPKPQVRSKVDADLTAGADQLTRSIAKFIEKSYQQQAHLLVETQRKTADTSVAPSKSRKGMNKSGAKELLDSTEAAEVISKVNLKVENIQCRFALDHHQRTIFLSAEYTQVEIETHRQALEATLKGEKERRELSAAESVYTEMTSLLLHAVRRGLTCQQSFTHFDVQNSGFIDTDHLVDGLARLGVGVTYPVAEKVLQLMAGPAASFLSYQDFQQYLTIQAQNDSLYNIHMEHSDPQRSSKTLNNTLNNSNNGHSSTKKKKVSSWDDPPTNSPNNSNKKKKSTLFPPTKDEKMSLIEGSMMDLTASQSMHSIDWQRMQSEERLNYTSNTELLTSSSLELPIPEHMYTSRPQQGSNSNKDGILPPWARNRSKRALQQLTSTTRTRSNTSNNNTVLKQEISSARQKLVTLLHPNSQDKNMTSTNDNSQEESKTVLENQLNNLEEVDHEEDDEPSHSNINPSNNTTDYHTVISDQTLLDTIANKHLISDLTTTNIQDELLHLENNVLMTYRVINGHEINKQIIRMKEENITLRYTSQLEEREKSLNNLPLQSQIPGPYEREQHLNKMKYDNEHDSNASTSNMKELLANDTLRQLHTESKSFTLVLVPDVFMTLDTLQSQYEALLQAYPLARLVLIGLIGLPNTIWPKHWMLTSSLQAKSIARLLHYLDTQDKLFYTNIDYTPHSQDVESIHRNLIFCAHGLGAYHMSRMLLHHLPELSMNIQMAIRHVVFINGILRINKKYRLICRDLRKAIQESNISEAHELITSLHFFDTYLSRNNKSQVLKKFWGSRRHLQYMKYMDASSNTKTNTNKLEGFIGVLEQLKAIVYSNDATNKNNYLNSKTNVSAVSAGDSFDGALVLSNSSYPVTAIQSTEDVFIDPKNALMYTANTLPPPRYLVPDIQQNQTENSVYVAWLQAGHEITQERNAYVLSIISNIVIAHNIAKSTDYDFVTEKAANSNVDSSNGSNLVRTKSGRYITVNADQEEFERKRERNTDSQGIETIYDETLGEEIKHVDDPFDVLDMMNIHSNSTGAHGSSFASLASNVASLAQQQQLKQAEEEAQAFRERNQTFIQTYRTSPTNINDTTTVNETEEESENIEDSEKRKLQLIEKQRRVQMNLDRRKRQLRQSRQNQLEYLYSKERDQVEQAIEKRELQVMHKEDLRSQYAADYALQTEIVEVSQQLAKEKTNQLRRLRRDEAAKMFQEQLARERAQRIEMRRQQAEQLIQRIQQEELTLQGMREGGYDMPGNLFNVNLHIEASNRLMRDLLECRQKYCEAIQRQRLMQEKYNIFIAQLAALETDERRLRRAIRLIEINPAIIGKELNAESQLDELRGSLATKQTQLLEMSATSKLRAKQLYTVNRSVQLLKLASKERDIQMHTRLTELYQIEVQLNDILKTQKVTKENYIIQKDRLRMQILQHQKRIDLLEKEQLRIKDHKHTLIDTDVWVAGVMQRCVTKELKKHLKSEHNKVSQEKYKITKELDVLKDRIYEITENISKVKRDMDKIHNVREVLLRNYNKYSNTSIDTMAKNLQKLQSKANQLETRKQKELDLDRLFIDKQVVKSKYSSSEEDDKKYNIQTSSINITKIRMKESEIRTKDERQFIGMDLLLHPEEYLQLTSIEIEQMKFDKDYHCQLSKADLQRILSLPDNVNLAMPFLYTNEEINVHRLINKYYRTMNDEFFKNRDFYSYQPEVFLKSASYIHSVQFKRHKQSSTGNGNTNNDGTQSVTSQGDDDQSMTSQNELSLLSSGNVQHLVHNEDIKNAEVIHDILLRESLRNRLRAMYFDEIPMNNTTDNDIDAESAAVDTRVNKLSEDEKKWLVIDRILNPYIYGDFEEDKDVHSLYDAAADRFHDFNNNHNNDAIPSSNTTIISDNMSVMSKQSKNTMNSSANKTSTSSKAIPAHIASKSKISSQSSSIINRLINSVATAAQVFHKNHPTNYQFKGQDGDLYQHLRDIYEYANQDHTTTNNDQLGNHLQDTLQMNFDSNSDLFNYYWHCPFNRQELHRIINTEGIKLKTAEEIMIKDLCNKYYVSDEESILGHAKMVLVQEIGSEVNQICQQVDEAVEYEQQRNKHEYLKEKKQLQIQLQQLKQIVDSNNKDSNNNDTVSVMSEATMDDIDEMDSPNHKSNISLSGASQETDPTDIKRIWGGFEAVHPASQGVESQLHYFSLSNFNASRDHPATYGIREELIQHALPVPQDADGNDVSDSDDDDNDNDEDNNNNDPSDIDEEVGDIAASHNVNLEDDPKTALALAVVSSAVNAENILTTAITKKKKRRTKKEASPRSRGIKILLNATKASKGMSIRKTKHANANAANNIDMFSVASNEYNVNSQNDVTSQFYICPSVSTLASQQQDFRHIRGKIVLLEEPENKIVFEVKESTIQSRQSRSHYFSIPDKDNLRVLELNVSVVYQGVFGQNGYKLGRLAAALFRLPIAANDTNVGSSYSMASESTPNAGKSTLPIPVGYTPYDSLAANLTQSIGRIVIKHQPKEQPIQPGTFQIIIGAAATSVYSITVHVRYARNALQVVDEQIQNAKQWQTRLPTCLLELDSIQESLRLAERKRLVCEKLILEAELESHSCQERMGKLTEKLRLDDEEMIMLEDERRAFQRELSILEVEFTQWTKVFASRCQEMEDIKEGIQMMYKIRREREDEKKSHQTKLDAARKDLPACIQILRNMTEAVNVAMSLNTTIIGTSNQESGAAKTGDYGGIKISTPAEDIRRTMKQFGFNALSLEEQQWSLLDQQLNPHKYEWLAEQLEKERADQLLLGKGAKNNMNTMEQLIYNNPALETFQLNKTEIEYILTTPFSMLNRREVVIRKLLTKYHDDSNYMKKSIAALAFAFDPHLAERIRSKHPNSYTKEEKEWESIDRILHPEIWNYYVNRQANFLDRHSKDAVIVPDQATDDKDGKKGKGKDNDNRRKNNIRRARNTLAYNKITNDDEDNQESATTNNATESNPPAVIQLDDKEDFQQTLQRLQQHTQTNLKVQLRSAMKQVQSTIHSKIWKCPYATKEQVLKIWKTPKHFLTTEDEKKTHALLHKYNGTYSSYMDLVLTSQERNKRLTLTQQPGHVIQWEKSGKLLSQDVDFRARQLLREIDRATNTRNEYIHSDVLHANDQKFPTKVLRMHLEDALDSLLVEQIKDRERAERNKIYNTDRANTLDDPDELSDDEEKNARRGVAKKARLVLDSSDDDSSDDDEETKRKKQQAAAESSDGNAGIYITNRVSASRLQKNRSNAPKNTETAMISDPNDTTFNHVLREQQTDDLADIFNASKVPGAMRGVIDLPQHQNIVEKVQKRSKRRLRRKEKLKQISTEEEVLQNKQLLAKQKVRQLSDEAMSDMMLQNAFGTKCCLACRTRKCQWRSAIDLPAVQERQRQLDAEMERIRLDRHSVVFESDVCLSAQLGGNRVFRRQDLVDELQDENKELTLRIDLDGVDKELHDAYATRKEVFESKYLHGFKIVLWTNHARVALEGRQSRLVALLVAKEVVEDMLDSMLEGWVFGERQSQFKAIGYVPSIKPDGLIRAGREQVSSALIVVERIKQRAMLRKQGIETDEARRGEMLEKAYEIELQSQQHREKVKIARDNNQHEQLLNETERTLKFGLFMLTLMYFRAMTFVKREQRSWAGDDDEVNVNNKNKQRKNMTDERLKMIDEENKAIQRKKKVEQILAKSRVGEARRKEREHAERREAIVKLQAIIRRQRLEIMSIELIQRVFRGFLGRKAAKRWALKRAELGAMNALLHATAITIQRMFRGYRARNYAVYKRMEMAQFIALMRIQESQQDEEIYWQTHPWSRFKKNRKEWATKKLETMLGRRVLGGNRLSDEEQARLEGKSIEEIRKQIEGFEDEDGDAEEGGDDDDEDEGERDDKVGDDMHQQMMSRSSQKGGRRGGMSAMNQSSKSGRTMKSFGSMRSDLDALLDDEEEN